MLDKKTTEQIVEFVRKRPRTIQEVAQLTGRNWRTADRYVDQIATEEGTLATRTFRGGTRGALKIVYATTQEQLRSSYVQEQLLSRILSGRVKEDFSPFEIYQYVPPENARAFLEQQRDETARIEQDVVSLFRSAQQRILIFSGNLSWANVVQGKTRVLGVLREAAERGVTVKIVSKIDLACIANLRRVLAVNARLGRDALEVRHAEQPLRCVIIDGALARLKERKHADYYRRGELERNTFVFYEITDPGWVEWLSQVFWNYFSSAIPCQKRMERIESIRDVALVRNKVTLK